jgi:hypothetical protein
MTYMVGRTNYQNASVLQVVEWEDSNFPSPEMLCYTSGKQQGSPLGYLEIHFYSQNDLNALEKERC